MVGVLTLSGGRGRTFGAVLAVVVVLLLAVGASARAASEYEPNDSRETAHGPIAGGTWYTAGIETINDFDWFVFYVKTYSQIEFSATAETKLSPSSYFYLYDRDGKLLLDDCCSSDFTASGEVVDRLPLTMTPGRYYLRVDGSQGSRYKFRIDPATSLTTSRECGEAIVARDLVAPQLATVNQSLAKNAERLAVEVAAVHAAKKEVRQASKKVQRLRAKVKRLRRLGRSGWVVRRTSARLRTARGQVQRAVDRLNGANEERQPIWEERRNLEALAGQHQQAIAGAEGQMATYC